MYVKFKLARNKHVLHAIRCTSIPCVKKIHAINSKNNQNLLLKNRSYPLYRQPIRDFSVISGIRGLLKLRYLLLGSAVGGGYQVKKKYDEFVSGLPETKWITDTVNDVFKDADTSWINNSVNNLTTKISSISENTRNWIKEAKEAQERAALQQAGVTLNLLDEDYTNEEDASPSTSRRNSAKMDKQSKKLQEELIETESKYKRKLEQLEKEKEDLKRQILFLKGDKRVRDRLSNKQLNKSLIDLYSEVLDELQDYDSPYDVQDMLPRVVVVGDQSAGKTSVLEMIANARIFPRGMGEMMTRSPVQVTLRQGPYHIAKFNDSEREYNLKDENDLEKLRNEIEYRMKCNVKNGQTVSNKVISLNIQGPNLRRVVLVDLPGIINTVTTEMKPETKEEIKKMTNHYMKNPNSIILCIQDGSIDVEKSLVTDLVSKADPDGRRTIFVLTKVDLAEKNWKNPDRLKKILDGKLFPMKALGYFGVVTGKGRTDETIDEIKHYEENFFKKSKLVRDGTLQLSKCTTSNLSEKVSECFWSMVKSSVELQADTFRAIRFNLETQWRNEFPQSRELTREDLFEKAKSELLDEVVNLSLRKNQYWEEQIKKDLWNKTKDFIFDKVFFPSYLTGDDNLSKTKLEINLNELSNFMPATSIDSATNVFLNEFKNLLLDQRKINYDEIYDKFKIFVCEERLKKHYKWENKAEEVLKIIQFVALQNSSIPDSNEWRSAVNNLQKVASEKLRELDIVINNMIGPSYLYSWLSWTSLTKEQVLNNYIKNELDKILNNSNGQPKYLINDEDRKYVRTSLELIRVQVTDEQINSMFDLLVRKKILIDTLKKAYDCRNGFTYYQHGLLNEIECEDVILFWRIDKMLTSTASSLRMQLVDREYQRLHDILKDILFDVYEDKELLKQLFTGKRIKIVEELNKVRNIQKKLEYFIQQLNKEKSK